MLYLVWLYAGLFVVFTGIHLFASFLKLDELRSPTKPIILLSILGMYLEWMHSKNIEPSALVVFALVTSWLGDVFLIPRGTKWFVIGGSFFWLSHFLFIGAYWESGISFGSMNPFVMAAVALVYAVTVTVLFRKLRPCLPKGLFIPMYLYLMTNGAMNVFAWFRLISGGCSAVSGVVTAVGAVLFFISDCSLFFVRFDKNCKMKSHFTVMLTYSVGEFLIALGLMLLSV